MATPITTKRFCFWLEEKSTHCLCNNHNIDLRQVSSIHFSWLFVSKRTDRKLNYTLCDGYNNVSNASDLSNKATENQDRK